MYQFHLNFVTEGSTELIQTDFIDDRGECLRSVRGKTAGSYRGAGTFQWTSGVRALALLALKTKALSLSSGEPAVSGGDGSLASSLAYAISKQPKWLSEMFNFELDGRLNSRRLFLVTNPNRKRVGPVSISLNPNLLKHQQISIWLNGERREEQSVMASIIEAIEQPAPLESSPILRTTEMKHSGHINVN